MNVDVEPAGPGAQICGNSYSSRLTHPRLPGPGSSLWSHDHTNKHRIMNCDGFWERSEQVCPTSPRQPSSSMNELHRVPASALLERTHGYSLLRQRTQIKVSKGKRHMRQSPGEIWRELPVVFSQWSREDAASFSQQWCVTAHIECYHQGGSPEPWCPTFLLGVSHIGMENLHIDLNNSVSCPSRGQMIQQGSRALHTSHCEHILSGQVWPSVPGIHRHSY